MPAYNYVSPSLTSFVENNRRLDSQRIALENTDDVTGAKLSSAATLGKSLLDSWVNRNTQMASNELNDALVNSQNNDALISEDALSSLKNQLLGETSYLNRNTVNDAYNSVEQRRAHQYTREQLDALNNLTPTGDALKQYQAVKNNILQYGAPMNNSQTELYNSQRQAILNNMPVSDILSKDVVDKLKKKAPNSPTILPQDIANYTTQIKQRLQQEYPKLDSNTISTLTTKVLDGMNLSSLRTKADFNKQVQEGVNSRAVEQAVDRAEEANKEKGSITSGKYRKYFNKHVRDWYTDYTGQPLTPDDTDALSADIPALYDLAQSFLPKGSSKKDVTTLTNALLSISKADDGIEIQTSPPTDWLGFRPPWLWDSYDNVYSLDKDDTEERSFILKQLIEALSPSAGSSSKNSAESKRLVEALQKKLKNTQKK